MGQPVKLSGTLILDARIAQAQQRSIAGQVSLGDARANRRAVAFRAQGARSFGRKAKRGHSMRFWPQLKRPKGGCEPGHIWRVCLFRTIASFPECLAPTLARTRMAMSRWAGSKARISSLSMEMPFAERRSPIVKRPAYPKPSAERETDRVARPPAIVVALAGPNGAGKSSFFDTFLTQAELQFVNADALALSFRIDAYSAAEMADSLRRRLIRRRESFIFETVFSDPVGDKVDFLRQAEEAGYFVLLIFIGIAHPSLSADRVAMRASQGGHDVPAQKLEERYPRTLANLQRALADLANVWVYDHSDIESGYRLVATKEGGQSIEIHGSTPDWLDPLLP